MTERLLEGDLPGAGALDVVAEMSSGFWSSFLLADVVVLGPPKDSEAHLSSMQRAALLAMTERVLPAGHLHVKPASEEDAANCGREYTPGNMFSLWIASSLAD